jgi:hypothetical protein
MDNEPNRGIPEEFRIEFFDCRRQLPNNELSSGLLVRFAARGVYLLPAFQNFNSSPRLIQALSEHANNTNFRI